MPSELKPLFWCVAKKQYDINRGEWRFVPNEGVHYANKMQAQAEADALNKEYEEDESEVRAESEQLNKKEEKEEYPKEKDDKQ